LRVFQALRNRDFRLLWIAGTVSSLGSWLLILAIPTQVFLSSRSLAATGLALAAEYFPLLVLGPIAGAVADRWDRRSLMIGADLSRTAIVAVMLLAVAPGRYWIFYCALAAESSATVLFVPALRAHTPIVTGTGPLLTSANALNTLSDGAVRLVGGPVGGFLLVTLGSKPLICADAISYLVSALALLMTSRGTSQSTPRATIVRSVICELREGLGFLRRQPTARALLLVTTVFLAANASLSAVLIPFTIDRLGGSQATGLVFAALGAGFLLSAPALRILLDRVEPRYFLGATLTATAASYWLLFDSASLRAALPAAGVTGMTGSMSLVIARTTMQRVTPNAVLGRVSAAFLTAEAAATLAGAAIGPLVAQAAGLTTLAAAASFTAVVAAAAAALVGKP
jgi:predicted MFS family arabinose efflux permease